MNEFKIGVTFPSMLMKDAERIKSSLENALLSAGCDMLFFCADGEVQKQADQISQMISESCNAIVVWPVGDGVAQALSQAKDNDIGVLLFLDKISDCSSADFFVGIDYRALGALQAEYIRDELDLDNAAGLNRKVAICGGILGNVKCLEALEGAMELLQQYIDSCAIEQTEPAYVSQISPDAGRELAISRGWGQELSAVLGLTEGVPAGVVAALCEKGCDAGNIPIVTGAGDDMETLANVRYGLQSMTVPCGYELLAAEAASAVAMLLNGEAPEGNTVISDDGGYEIAGFVGCGEACDVNTDFALKPRKLLYISINSQSGNEYFVGETFPNSKMTVVAHYDYGQPEDVSERCVYNPSSLSSVGAVNISVSYTENGVTATDSATISVMSRVLSGIEVSAYPDKILYVAQDIFESDGIVVKAEYENGTVRTLAPAALTFSPSILSVSGESVAVTVSYSENNVVASAQIFVKVAQKTPTDLRITNRPKQRVYLAGDEYCADGLSLEVQYGNLVWREISSDLCVFSPALLSADDDISVSYAENGQTVTAVLENTVVLEKTLTGLRIARRPDKTEYFQGESFDVGGMIVQAQYSGDVWRDVNGFCVGTEPLTAQDSCVVVSYSEGETEKSAVVPVVVHRSGLCGLEITSLPNKTLYLEGEHFDKRGMVVTALYTDGAREEVKNYSFTPSGPLASSGSDGKTNITISLKQGAVLQTASLEISVLSKNIDIGRQNQTELKFDCGAGGASLNLFTGRLLFEHEDASIGANSFGLSVNHVYNSCFDEQYALKYGENADDYFRTGMGKGFKLDIQQYLVDDGGSKVYIDGSGMRHKFVPLDGSDGIFYDVDGMGLVLSEENGELAISDNAGNKMFFDGGRLVRTVSCHNAQLQKIFQYNQSGQLTRAYDSRKPDNGIVFEYDLSTGLLKAMKCMKSTLSKRSVSFVYDGDGRLTCISDGEQDKTMFSYESGGLLGIAASLPDKSALKFGYHTDGRLKCVLSGAAEASVDGETQTASISISDADVVKRTFFDFGSQNGASATVRYQRGAEADDDKDLCVAYFFNADGYATAVLEAENEASPSFKAMEKSAGVEVPLSGSAKNRTINGKTVFQLDSDSIVALTDLDAAAEYRKLKCPDFDFFNVGFWLMLDGYAKTPKAKIVVTSKDTASKKTTDEGEAAVDGSAAGVWQYVSVPVKISRSNLQKIELEIATSGTPTAFFAADMRLRYAPRSRYYLTDGENWAALDSATGIKYRTSPAAEYVTREINEDCYMSEKDLQATYLSRFKTRALSENGAKFVLSLCDCTEKLLVDSISLCAEGKEFPLCFGTDEYGTGTRAQFFQETLSPDGDVYTYVIPHFLTQASEIGTTEGCMMTVTESNLFAKLDRKGNPVPDHKESFSKTYVDLKGRTLCEIDEYGVETAYEYDANGEVSKKTLRHADTEEELIIETTATDLSLQQKTPFNVLTDGFNDPLGMLTERTFKGRNETESNALTVQYAYDALGKRIVSIENNAGGKNLLTYDQNGRLKAVTPTGWEASGGYGYSFEYNAVGDLARVRLTEDAQSEGSVLAESEADYAAGTVTTRRFRGTTRADEVKVTTDKYGRTTSLEEKSDWASNAKSAVFTRQTLSESAGAAEVTRMYDPFENRTYTYAYDDANNCTGYEVFDGNGTSCKKRFGVRKTSENRTAYYLRRDGSYWESYCEAIYDDKLLNPRIKELVFNVGNGGNRAYFTYDELGRIKSKDFAVDGSEIAEYEYLSGTTLKSGITIKQNDGKEYNYTYEYDNRGNLKKSHIADWGNGSKKTKSYSYDKAGRLISESDGQSNFQYTYNADGTLASDGQKTYVYDKGRLKRTNSNAGTKYFMHDNLGNCTHFGRETEASEANLIWERGSKLKSMILPEGETAHYFYNSRGVRYKKTVGGTTTAFDYDTDKLVALERQSASKKESITFIYDSEGIAGFYHDGGLVGLFVKDASGNVISIVNNLFGEMARYEYDAWGKCTIVKDTQFLFGKIGEINPIRWKSQYFDAESGFYYIDGRYYSPEIRQYLSPENPESELMNAFTIYDINPYFLCLTNPISVEYNENTAFPSIQLVYDPPKLTKWQAFWRSGKNYLKGSAFLATSIYAIVSALSILSCGVLTPLMTVVGIATFAAGIATGINAAAEFQEGLTNFNFVRDIWFAGNKKVYNWYSLGIEAITSIGMLWIGGWLNYNAPRIQAYKNISNYKYSKSAGKHIGE
ncbi:MAG: substrate-binding domain-containing protein, partial [Christensenellales bacterium]